MFFTVFSYICTQNRFPMEENKPIDYAEVITLEDAKRLKLPFFEGLAAGYPSPAGDYQHESLDLNEKFVRHPESSYFVRVRGESMIGTGIFDDDICLVDRQEEIDDGNIVVASRFSRYFWGVMPSILLKVRCRTVRSVKPQCCATASLLQSGWAAMMRLASSTRSWAIHSVYFSPC